MSSPDESVSRLAIAVVASALLHAVAVVWVPHDFFPASERILAVAPRAVPLEVGFMAPAAPRAAPDPTARRPAAAAAAPQPVAAPAAVAEPAGHSQPFTVADPDALDRGPRILDDRVSSIAVPLQDYPRPGRVILQIWIGPSGLVDGVTIAGGGELPLPVLDAIVDGFKASTFVPATRQGKPVGAMMKVEVDYGPGVE